LYPYRVCIIATFITKTWLFATRCQILRLKCNKFDFGWGSAPDPAGGAYSAPPDPLAGFKGAALQQGGGRERDGEREGEGKGREDEGREGRERERRREGERGNGRYGTGHGKGKGRRGATAPQTLIPGAATGG